MFEILNAGSRETYPYEGPRRTEESRRGTERRNTHVEDTHGPARFPLLLSKSTSNTDAPGGGEWHDAMPLPRKKKRKMMTTTSCTARGRAGWEESDLTRRKRQKRARMLQLQPCSRPWIARRNYYEHVMHNWLWLIFFVDRSSQRDAKSGRGISFRLSHTIELFVCDLVNGEFGYNQMIESIFT